VGRGQPALVGTGSLIITTDISPELRRFGKHADNCQWCKRSVEDGDVADEALCRKGLLLFRKAEARARRDALSKGG
jgi:hypothetical protein